MKITEEMVLNELRETNALLSGHFVLSSGRHSGNYCQCAQLLRFPKRAALVLERVAEQVREANLGITKVCGPAMGAILVSYELGRLLDVETIFTERNKETDEMELRRGFEVGPGDRVLVVEDAITTGKSAMEAVKVLKSLGAEVVALGCIADRRAEGVELPYDVYSAVRLDFASYPADDCPICREGKIPPVKPGSRRK